MEKKVFPGIIGGFIGSVVGILGGGILGLVVGGTFLGGFDIYENIGLEGYEVAAYIGAAIGAIVFQYWASNGHGRLRIRGEKQRECMNNPDN